MIRAGCIFAPFSIQKHLFRFRSDATLENQRLAKRNICIMEESRLSGLDCWYKKRTSEKGKPAERQGRKATGLRVLPTTAGRQT